MYATPGGDRILLGAERIFYMHTLGMIVDMIAEGDVQLGVTAFDDLQRNQKLVVLYRSARGLVRPNEPAPRLTAVVEAAVAAVYEFAKDQVLHEIEEIDAEDSDDDQSYWRSLILAAARERLELDLPHVDSRDKEIWPFLIECLAGCVLWDNDYESQAILDLPPEQSRQARTTLGIDDEYYTDVPPDPPDDQINLYVDALMGLTADVR